MSSHAKRNYLREICTEKILSDVFKQTDKINKQFKKIFQQIKKNCSKSFSDLSNSSDVKEQIIKQINTLKPFKMELHKAIPKKPFVSEEENNCKKDIDLKHHKIELVISIGTNVNECKLMTTFALGSFLLFQLKSRRLGENLTIQLLLTTAQLLVTGVSLIYQVDEFFLMFLV